MTSAAETPRPAAFADAVRATGAILLGAGLILLASADLPTPLPWTYGLLPLALLWLTRKVGLLFGSLAGRFRMPFGSTNATCCLPPESSHRMKSG